MREFTWQKAAKPEGLIRSIARMGDEGDRKYDRKLRLFACACVRLHWERVQEEKDRLIVELAEKCADGEISVAELEAKREKSIWKREGKPPLWASLLAASAQDCAKRNVVQAALNCSHSMTNAACYFDGASPSASQEAWAAYLKTRESAKRQHVAILHDLFGNPFQPVEIEPAALTWNRGHVVALARAIYAQHAFQRMPELGDLLERAGCADEKVLAHCRSGGRHFRGCWVVDLLLGKHRPLDPTPKRRVRLLSADDDKLLPYDTYVVLWTQSRCDGVKRSGQLGSRPDVLFGGPHLSEPRFSKYHIRAGDYILPIRVERGVMYILSRMRVSQLMALDSYIDSYPDVFTGCDTGKAPFAILDDWLRLHPDKRYLVASCTDEVALIEEATPLRLDLAVPPDLLQRLVFKSGNRENKLGSIVDGKLTSSLSLQGCYRRLSKQSALEIEALLRGAESTSKHQ
jgi:hypothetical protein